jgi:ferric enterobactin receptor
VLAFLALYSVTMVADTPPLTEATTQDIEVSTASESSDEALTITITAPRRSRNARIDARNYQIKTPDQSTLTTEDVIARLPGVIREINGKLSILGDSNIRYRVDDVAFPTDLALQIPANEIDRIEVITNAGADQSGNDTIIINIITKKTQLAEGLSLNFKTDSLKNSKLNSYWSRHFDGTYYTNMINAEASRRQKDNSLDTAFMTPNEIGRKRKETSSSLSTTRSVSLMQALSKKMDNGYAVAGVYSFYQSRYNSFRESLSEYANETTTFRPRKSENPFKNKNQSQAWVLTLSLDKPKRKSNVSLSFNKSGSKTRNEDRETDIINGSQAKFRSLETKPNQTLTLSATDERHFNKNRILKYGLEMNYNDEESVFESSAPVISLDKYRVKSELSSVYVSWQTSLNKLQVLPGMRLEQLKYTIISNGSEVGRERKLTRTLPSLHLSYPLDQKKKLTLSYSRRSDNLDASNLNPVARNLGFRNLTQGNPDLKLAQTDRYEAGFERVEGPTSFTITSFYRDSQDIQFSENRYLGDEVWLSTPINLDQYKETGLNINYKSTRGRLVYALDGLWVDRSQVYNDGGFKVKRQDGSGDLKLNLTYRLSSKDSFIWLVQYRGKRQFANTATSDNISSSLKLNRNLPKQASIALEAVNFLASDETISTTQTADYRSVRLSREPVRAIRLSLSKDF